jgi:hypothetical protein
LQCAAKNLHCIGFASHPQHCIALHIVIALRCILRISYLPASHRAITALHRTASQPIALLLRLPSHEIAFLSEWIASNYNECLPGIAFDVLMTLHCIARSLAFDDVVLHRSQPCFAFVATCCFFVRLFSDVLFLGGCYCRFCATNKTMKDISRSGAVP